jgi:predicted ATP-dependent protease
VVEAARLNQFFIYPIETVDQAIELLMGAAAGRRNKNGKFEKNSINYKVENKLKEFTRRRFEKRKAKRKN